ncbi:helix-turn-helix domain-containing protein [Kribbella deserti]|uniref:Helix-turn-helix domain-containing protein n=1 Tax=Kribbella deserti TaxID=1926257 RepID=A0ABV6QF34_9ACTN
MTNWLLVSEVAQVMRVSDHHVRRLIRTGLLSAVNVGGERRPTYRIDQRAVESYMNARRTLIMDRPPPR